MNYGMRFMTLYRRQGSRPSPWKRNGKKLSWEALQIAVKRREVKTKGEKDNYKDNYKTECRVPENSKTRQESLLQRSMQRNRGKGQNGKD